MRAGSVVVDLPHAAAMSRARPGERVVGWRENQRPGQPRRSLAADSSALFARNLYNFLSAFWDKDKGAPVLPDDDEIVKGVRLTKGGKIVNERLTAA